VLKNHLSPKPIVIAERFRFHKRDQRPDESVRDFITQLRKLSEHCAFGTALDDTLRDRLVCGLRCQHTQKKLLTVTQLTLNKALEICVAMETASKDAAELQSKNGFASVNKIQAKPVHHKRQGKKTQKPDTNMTKCYRCGKDGHSPQDCYFKDTDCRKCGKTGHIERVCRGKKASNPGHKPKKSYFLTDDDDEYIASMEINELRDNPKEILWIEPTVNGKHLKMELDTGSARSVISREDFVKHFKGLKWEKSDITLKTYSGEVINPLGRVQVSVRLKEIEETLPLYIVQNGGPPLLGRQWMNALFGKQWLENLSVNHVESHSPQEEIQTILGKYKSVFGEDLGTLKEIKAKFSLKPDTKPKFCKARPVPHSLKPAVDIELDRLQNLGILKPVDHSEWATPIVVVPKKDKTVRICGDFKVTLNQCINVDQYPLPRIDEIFSNLSGGEHFTKLDLKNAYLQMQIEEEYQEFLTINTHRGLFRFNRLMYGVASAPAVWQRAMDQVLQGIPGVHCIIDDMIITGSTTEEHLNNLEKVLSRLETFNLRANIKKCDIFKDSVEFCGHKIDKHGLHKTGEKVKAVVEAKRPENLTELRAFLGLVNYYGKFMPNLSTILRPLHKLLEKDSQWKWTTDCNNAFSKVKELMKSDLVLAHYNPHLPVRLSCDASPFGLGAVLSHLYPSGEERPIAFASRTLNSAERNYSQIDKEALGIVWGIKHFQMYIYGRHFSLLTDHKPLVSIFHPQKGISLTTAARLQRYALFLSGLDYSIEYRNTKQHGNADGLSRLPLASKDNSEESELEIFDSAHIFHMTQMEALPVAAKEVKRRTARDPVLSRVYEATMRGWNDAMDKDLTPYFSRREEITVHQGCLLWGIRVIIPEPLRKEILTMIHEGHLGVVKMKAIARSHVWWPGIDADIEECAKKCSGCMDHRNAAPEAPIHPWEFPDRPWQRIHVDFAGPFLGSMFLIIVDAHSKWPEVINMNKTTAAHTIEVLRTVFARNGLPEHVISDNGPQFVSEEFQLFMKSNSIRHTTSSPYHPRTNGLAERFVQTFKSAMKSSKYDEGSLQKKLSNFLIAYRNTPQSATNETPAQIFIGRKLTTKLDRVKPSMTRSVEKSQEKMRGQIRTKLRSFSVGDNVLVRDYRKRDHKWIPGVIHRNTGPLSYEVEVSPGNTWRRHTDQILSSIQQPFSDAKLHIPDVDTHIDVVPTEQISDTCSSPKSPSPVAETLSASPAAAVIQDSPPKAELTASTPRRYPTRNRKPVVKMNL
jgi:hypothetical protein